MALSAFNPIDYMNNLIKAGLTREQAEVQAQAILSILEDDRTTKRDLYDLKDALIAEIRQLKR